MVTDYLVTACVFVSLSVLDLYPSLFVAVCPVRALGYGFTSWSVAEEKIDCQRIKSDLFVYFASSDGLRATNVPTAALIQYLQCSESLRIWFWLSHHCNTIIMNWIHDLFANAHLSHIILFSFPLPLCRSSFWARRKRR